MKKKLKILIKSTLQKIHRFNYHHQHKLKAEATLKSIESEKGKLSQIFKKMSQEYAHEVLGWTGFAPWLNVYAAIAGEFKEGWIPDNYYGVFLVPKLKGLYGRISGAKSLSSKLLNTDKLPDIVYYVNGLFFTSSMKMLPVESVGKYLFNNNDRIVYKVDNSLQGKGIHIFTKETFNTATIYSLGNGVFQKYIEQHVFFEEIMPKSVATLRLTSVIENDGSASCRAAYLRIGRSEDSYVKSSSAIKVSVDVISGRLHEQGYLPNFCSVKSHPDTHFTFEGKVLPKFSECVAYILKTHQEIPFCRSIGWDLIVDKDEQIQLIEWNGNHNGIKFSEATQGPCFADLGWEELWKE